MSDFGTMAVGVRIGNAVDPSFFFSWTMLLRSGKLRPGDKILNPAVGLPHGPAANILIGWFLQSGCDSLLFLDDDMEFSPAAIDTLRSDDHGFDAMSCLYVTRKRNHTPIVVTGWSEEHCKPKLAKFEDIKGVMPVEYIGMGGLIVKRWVIEKILDRWPERPLIVFDPYRGEDGRFAEDIRAVGGKIGVNTNVRFGHRTTVALYWNPEAQDLDYAENDYGLSILRQREAKENKS